MMKMKMGHPPSKEGKRSCIALQRVEAMLPLMRFVRTAMKLELHPVMEKRRYPVMERRVFAKKQRIATTM
jgi:hypothetical protein